LPEGRLLDEGGDDRYADGVVANISMFPRATAQRVEAVRKNVREIPDERIDRSVDPCVIVRRVRSSSWCGPRS
jgi:hypothetical protein